MLKFILCDDNEIHINYLKKELEHVLKTNNLNGSIAYYSDNPLDIVVYSKKHADENNVYMLDIDFKDNINGIDLAKLIRKHEATAYIIFISAYREYSLMAYKAKTFDFLLKPFNLKEFESCIINLFKDYENVMKRNNPTISIKSGSIMHVIDVYDIFYVEKFRNIAVFHTKKGIVQGYETLENMQLKLERYDFYRCHRSYLINLKYVDYIILDKDLVYMKNGDMVYVSRNYKKGLVELVK